MLPGDKIAMEHTGLELTTSSLPVKRAPNCANGPYLSAVPQITTQPLAVAASRTTYGIGPRDEKKCRGQYNRSRTHIHERVDEFILS